MEFVNVLLGVGSGIALYGVGAAAGAMFDASKSCRTWSQTGRATVDILKDAVSTSEKPQGYLLRRAKHANGSKRAYPSIH